MKEHRFVNHSKEYAKGDVHVNTAENRHGFLRAWLRKFRGVSKHYLGKYISFFELLFNSKKTSIHHYVPDGLGDERNSKAFSDNPIPPSNPS